MIHQNKLMQSLWLSRAQDKSYCCKTAQELGLLHITKPCDIVNAVHKNDITEKLRTTSKTLEN